MLEVWWADLTQGSMERDWSLLSDAERARANRLVRSEDKHSKTASFAFLRTVLGRRLKRAPATLDLQVEEHGKPYLQGREVAFNLSHSGDLAVLAIGGSAELGVDVEHMPREVDFLTLSRRFFAPPEWEWLERQKDVRTSFYTIWTRKEAYIKALGTGLRHPLDQFCVLDGLTDVAGKALTRWSPADVPLPREDYRAALVVEGPLVAWRVRQFTWDEP